MDNIIYKRVESIDVLVHTIENLDRVLLEKYLDIKLLILDRFVFISFFVLFYMTPRCINNCLN